MERTSFNENESKIAPKKFDKLGLFVAMSVATATFLPSLLDTDPASEALAEKRKKADAIIEEKRENFLNQIRAAQERYEVNSIGALMAHLEESQAAKLSLAIENKFRQVGVSESDIERAKGSIEMELGEKINEIKLSFPRGNKDIDLGGRPNADIVGDLLKVKFAYDLLDY